MVLCVIVNDACIVLNLYLLLDHVDGGIQVQAPAIDKSHKGVNLRDVPFEENICIDHQFTLLLV